MNYLEVFAIKIEQPLCDFYLTSMKAKDVRSIAFSEQLQYIDEKGTLAGSQRKVDKKRLKDIGKFIDSVEMSFPNTIILAVNYSQKGELINDVNIRWDIQHLEGNLYKVKVPTDTKLAAIIDGQHRLNGFDSEFIENENRLEVDLPCALFFDLPNSYQAFLFATINGNQKKVDKSIALEQFGFNVEEEPQNSWTPEKLAVFFTRKLNFKESPLHGHIKIAPKISEELKEMVFATEKQWSVSTATIVDGILGLISSKPKRDRVEMAQENIWGKRSRSMVEKFKTDSSPLRALYLENQDDKIFDIVLRYLDAAKETVWANYNPNSYIFKTVGIQALFDVLKAILQVNPNEIEENVNFRKYLDKVSKIDFSDKFFQASGIGRSRIKNTVKIQIGLLQRDKVKKNDLKFYDQILEGVNTNIDTDRWVWFDEAENAVLNLLENAEWNLENKTVDLYLGDDFETRTTFKSYDTLFGKLVEVAEVAFNNHLPADNEFAEEQRENFDADDLVASTLTSYEDKLNNLRWKK